MMCELISINRAYDNTDISIVFNAKHGVSSLEQ